MNTSSQFGIQWKQKKMYKNLSPDIKMENNSEKMSLIHIHTRTHSKKPYNEHMKSKQKSTIFFVSVDSLKFNDFIENL